MGTYEKMNKSYNVDFLYEAATSTQRGNNP